MQTTHGDSYPVTKGRMVFVHFWLYHFTLFGTLAGIFGYEFHANPSSGGLGIVFLVLGGVSLFFGFQVLKAFTDPLPAWLDYWLTPAHREPATDRQMRGL